MALLSPTLRMLFLTSLVLVGFVIQGCSRGSYVARGSGVTKQLDRNGWMLIYAERNEIRVYDRGSVVVLGLNPAGYDSLDHWIGYSSKPGTVFFYRSGENHFRLLEIDARKTGLKSTNLAPAYTECNPHEYGIHDGKLWVVRGVKHKAVLWSYSRSGKWKQEAWWNLPKTIPVARLWSRSPAVDGSNVVFMSPSDYLLLGSNKGGAVRVLSDGDPAYVDPGFNDDASGEIAPVIMPGTDLVIYCSNLLGNPGGLEFLSVDRRTGQKMTYTIPKHGQPLRSMPPPECILTIRSVPSKDYVACEILVSGLSAIALVDIHSGKSEYLPMLVERYQWCLVDAPSRSSQEQGKSKTGEGG